MQQGVPFDPSCPWTGYFVLDKARSMVPTVHLEAMGASDLAKEAAEKVDIAYVIAQEELSAISIKHQSQLGEKERRLVLGEEFKDTARDGSSIRLQLQALTAQHLTIITDWSRGRIQDTRAKAADGQSYVQDVIFLHNSGVQSRTTRIFLRALPPPEPTQ